MASTTKRADFEAVFPGLAKDILAHAKKYNLPANALEWFEKVFLDSPSSFPIPHRKCSRDLGETKGQNFPIDKLEHHYSLSSPTLLVASSTAVFPSPTPVSPSSRSP